MTSSTNLQSKLFEIIEPAIFNNQDTDYLDQALAKLQSLIESETRKARLKSYEDIHHIHMRHDWNDTSQDLFNWLQAEGHALNRSQKDNNGEDSQMAAPTNTELREATTTSTMAITSTDAGNTRVTSIFTESELSYEASYINK